MILKFSNKLKISLSFIEIAITVGVTAGCLHYSNTNACEVYMNSKPIEYTNSKKELYHEEDNTDNRNISKMSSTVTTMSIPSKGTITSPFGERWGAMHKGIDIGAPMGSPICAAVDGRVSCAEWENGYGNVIKIDHGGQMQTIYAHCSSISARVGEFVNQGEKIGEVGSTGRSTGPHVHFEIRINGEPQNPLKYLK